MAGENAQATVDAQGMRARNSALLLNLIWKERQVSRADLARRTGLSPSTVSAIVGDLERSGLVQSTGEGISRGGRRPTLLGFCDDAFAIVGVELGASHVLVTLTNLRGEVQAARHGAHAVQGDPEGALALIRSSIDDCLRSERVARRRLLGIGVAVPSPVHPSAPGRLSPLILPAWSGYDVQAHLAGAYNVPVFVDNDANLGALAEGWWGAGRSGDDLTYIKVATGIGAGYVIRGEVYRGAGGTAGEIGHLAVDPSGPRCVCGLNGCLTTFIGSKAIRTLARERMTGERGRTPTIADIVKSAKAGDAAARTIVDEVGHFLGIAVAGLVNLMNPAVVVLGGEITAVGDLLLDRLRETVRARALSTSVTETRLVTSNLGEQAIAVGAATLVLQAALHDRALFPTPFLAVS
ncbi:MAG: transcriptional regulator, family [Myxococcales bacterium]|nr:transcriptional regulator, family [Myxococcales bacterium]